MTAHRFNREVHGARGLFSAMVFIYHVYHSRLPSFPMISGSTLGYYGFDSMKFGVELFFGISGLVIIGALQRAPSAGAFMWDRVARILPTLWASLLAIMFLYAVAGRNLPSFGVLTANFLAPPPFFKVSLLHPAAWSLGYEFTLYGLCCVAWMMRAAGVKGWIQLACIAGVLFLILFPRGILMAAGVAIAVGLPRPRWMDAAARFPSVFLVLFLALWRMMDIAAASRIRMMNPLDADLDVWLTFVPYIAIGGFVGSIALLGIERGHGLLGVWLRTPVMQWLGTISYSFYLWHPVCMAAVKFAMIKAGVPDMLGEWSQLAFMLLALPPSLIVSLWSQRLLEQRATRFLRNIGRVQLTHARPAIPGIDIRPEGDHG